MTTINSNNKRLAKNTILLYIRMLLNMVISLYTSRIVLATLGFEDYGLYNVVGGVVMMFTFMQSALTSSTQRFLNFAIGEKSFDKLQRTFSTSVYIHFLVAIIVFILAQTIGLFFIFDKLNIPQERLNAAFWVYQMSVCSCITIIISLPYNAIIIARERMSTFAYISILEVSLKLLIVYLLQISPFDKLIVYSILMFTVQLSIRSIYQCYCKKHFLETKLIKSFDISLIKKLGSFIGWNLFGNIAMIGLTQGINIILNMCNGLIVNASRAIAVQVQGAINGFCSNFQVAINPQITKACASKNYDYMMSLVYRSCKFSFFVLFMLSLPVIIEINKILTLWLKEVPLYTANFIQIILCISLIDSVSNGLGAAIMSNGRIKYYQMINSFILLMTLPLSFFFLKQGYPPAIVFIVHWCFDLLSQFARLFFVKHYYSNFSIITYIKKVYIPILMITITAPILPFIVHTSLPDSMFRLISVIILSITSTSLTIYILGLEKTEKELLRTSIKNIINKFIR